MFPGNARPSPASCPGRTVEGMDNRDEVRDFLTSRRDRLTPGQAGVPLYGRPALRQGAAPRGGRHARRHEHRLLHAPGAGNLSGAPTESLTRWRVPSGSTRPRGRTCSTSPPPPTDPPRWGAVRRAPPDPAGRAAPRAHPARGRVCCASSTASAPPRTSATTAWTSSPPTGSAGLCSPTSTQRAPPASTWPATYSSRCLRDFYTQWDVVARDAVAALRIEAGRNPYDRGLTDLVGAALSPQRRVPHLVGLPQRQVPHHRHQDAAPPRRGRARTHRRSTHPARRPRPDHHRLHRRTPQRLRTGPELPREPRRPGIPADPRESETIEETKGRWASTPRHHWRPGQPAMPGGHDVRGIGHQGPRREHPDHPPGTRRRHHVRRHRRCLLRWRVRGIVGKALTGRRDDIVLATKVLMPMGDDLNRRGNTRRWIIPEAEDSLRRLGTDWIDLYQVHRSDPETDLDVTLAHSPTWSAGKIRYFGHSTFPVRRSSRPNGPPSAATACASAPSSRPIRSSPGASKTTSSPPAALWHGRCPTAPWRGGGFLAATARTTEGPVSPPVSA